MKGWENHRIKTEWRFYYLLEWRMDSSLTSLGTFPSFLLHIMEMIRKWRFPPFWSEPSEIRIELGPQVMGGHVWILESWSWKETYNPHTNLLHTWVPLFTKLSILLFAYSLTHSYIPSRSRHHSRHHNPGTACWSLLTVPGHGNSPP